MLKFIFNFLILTIFIHSFIQYLSGHELEVYKECILPDMAKFFYEQGDYDRAISLYEDLYFYRVIEQKNSDASTFVHINTLISILVHEANYDRIKEIICASVESTTEIQTIFAQLNVDFSRSDRWLVEYHKSVSARYEPSHSAVFYSLTGLEESLMKDGNFRFIKHLEQFKTMAHGENNQSDDNGISIVLLECLSSLCGGSGDITYQVSIIITILFYYYSSSLYKCSTCLHL